MIFDPSKLTWKCHVCGDVRPDAAISVLKRSRMLNGVPFEERVRYCRDRMACFEGAKTFRFVGGASDV